MLVVRGLIISTLFLGGCCSLLYGLWLLHPALAYVAGGVMAIFCSITGTISGKKAGK